MKLINIMNSATESTQSNSFTETFNDYLNSYKGQVKSKGSDSYYHIDFVTEAYNQGYTDGKKCGKQDLIDELVNSRVERFTNQANQIYILSKHIINSVHSLGYNFKSLYINLDFDKPSVILAIPNEILIIDDFVNAAYQKIFESKRIFNKLFGELLDIGIIGADDLNETTLIDDGFGYKEDY